MIPTLSANIKTPEDAKHSQQYRTKSDKGIYLSNVAKLRVPRTQLGVLLLFALDHYHHTAITQLLAVKAYS